MRKPVFAICEQQRQSAQSHQHICCSLPGWYNNTSTYYSRNFKTLASLCSQVGRLESDLVANPEDRFSLDEAHLT